MSLLTSLLRIRIQTTSFIKDPGIRTHITESEIVKIVNRIITRMWLKSNDDIVLFFVQNNLKNVGEWELNQFFLHPRMLIFQMRFHTILN